jgi:isoquinoline 1-oxidoreductase beta subunit
VRARGAEGASDRPIVISNVSGANVGGAGVSRRQFLQGVSAVGGLVLAAGFSSAAQAADPPKYGRDGMPNGWSDDPLVFVAIGEDGIVSIVCHRSEMGQGVRTGMPMIVADELEADWKRVRVVQATGDEKRFGNQDTDGSRSTRHFFEPMRRCGAAARTMLEAAAAAKWGVPVGEVHARNHEVVHAKSGRRAGYGSLAKAAAAQTVPARDTVRLKDPSKFRYIGKGNLKLVDGPDITTGKAQYGIDTRLPGMLYAVVARPPVYAGKMVSYDATETLKVPGVLKVVEIEPSPAPALFNPLGGIGVVARNTWAAIQGRRRSRWCGTTGPTRATTRRPSRPRWRSPRASRGRSCATTATSTGRWRARRSGSRPSTTSRTSRMRRWSRRPPPSASSTARPRRGPASSRPRPPATWSPSGSASRPTT